MEIQTKEFSEFQTLVYKISGITLGEGKESLVSSRISKRLRVLGLNDFRSYLDWVKSDSQQDEIVHLIDAISTNVTSFFREPEHFDFIKDCVCKWEKEGQKRFRFWSAACSSGEEPYTLAMTLDQCGLSGCDMKILATDLSSRILAAAQKGIYSESKLDGLPAGISSKYFTPIRGLTDKQFAVQSRIKEMVVFKRMNLSSPPFPMKGPLDIILIRNVMIYFDNRVRTQLINAAHSLLKPGGYLIVGHSESLTGLTNNFKSIRPSIYQKSKI